MKEKPIDEEPKSPFSTWLSEHRQGTTELELSDALTELTKAVLETGKKGTLTLKVTVVSGGDEMVIVSDDVKVTAPEPARSVSIYFVDDEAHLRRENPRQGRLPLREVQRPANVTEIN